MLVAGIGCRAGVGAAAVVEAVDHALHHCQLSRNQLGALATAATKGAERGIAEAAEVLCLPLLLIDDEEMSHAASSTLTVSTRVLALKGVPSVAEAAALSAAGRSARLLAPRFATATVTCAIAEGDGA